MKKKKIRKKTAKSGVRAISFAERTRGVMAFILGATLIVSAVIASADGITGIKDVARYLLSHWVGRVLLAAVGISYLTYGAWKIIMGEN